MSSRSISNPDIRWDIQRVAPEVVKRAATFQTAILADVAGRRGTMHGRIRALSPSMIVAGPAFTVEVRPGDNLMIHAAAAIAEAGDVLVIDGKGDQTCALMGSILMTQCRELGIAGVVVDAAVRDTEEIREMGYPVFSVGSNPNGPTKQVPGRINWPVSVGGVAVHPGDLIVGDADGVVVVERERSEFLVKLAAKKFADEAERMKGIRAREQLTAPWLDRALRSAGVLKEGESL